MQFIRPRGVVEMIGVSRTTLWRLVQAGIFPQPVRITARSRAFLLEAVEAWMKARLTSTSQTCVRPASSVHEISPAAGGRPGSPFAGTHMVRGLRRARASGATLLELTRCLDRAAQGRIMPAKDGQQGDHRACESR